MNDIEILQNIKKDPSSFAVVFRQFYKPIFGYVFRRTGNMDDAADITADTFLKASIHIHHFNYTGVSIKSWLYRIATNEVNGYFRTHNKRTSVFKRLDFADKRLFAESFEEDKEALRTELEKHQQYLQVLQALKTLPAKYQAVIALRYFEDKDYKEIAAILDLKEGTLKSLLSHGVELLRKKCNHL